MQKSLKLKYDSKGRLAESLTTAVFGLICVSRTTYDYDAEGNLVQETSWHDLKRIKSIKRYSPAPQEPALHSSS